MYNGRAALSCSMNLFPTENYFTAATKRVISKISKRKGKDSGEIVLYPVNIDEHCRRRRGPVVRALDLKSGGPGFKSRLGHACK